MLDFLKKLFSAKELNAALAWQAAGHEAGSAYWLYAAPVHLVLQRDSFSLSAPVPLSLTLDEIEDLTSALNQHFESSGKQFFWYENMWFLRLENNPNIQTTSPKIALNQDISAYVPTGAGAMQWASFSNEVQMLLFEHPVNQAREVQKLPVINSIWCYGGGQVA